MSSGETEDPEAFAKDHKSDAQEARLGGRFEEAAQIMEDALQTLERDMQELVGDAKFGDRAKKLARALSDSYGVLGGIQRSAGRYAESFAAYDKGNGFERSPSYGITNSYNLTQRLVAQVLVEPAALVVGATLRAELASALAKVQEQIAGPRQNDAWARADLAMIALLLGETSVEAAAWERLRDMNPPAYVFGSTSKVIQDLLNRVASDPNSALAPVVERLASAAELLTTAQTKIG